ncbi:MAG: hypothetical protein SVX43_11690, partial [Cyanobacteriota bacterium]|nr:hypothetical protein [Cyanobacteriota bacterium]
MKFPADRVPTESALANNLPTPIALVLSIVVTSGPTPYLLLRTASGNRYLSLVGGNCWTVGRNEENNF